MNFPFEYKKGKKRHSFLLKRKKMSEVLLYDYREKGPVKRRIDGTPVGNNVFGTVFTDGLGPAFGGDMGFLTGVPSAPFVNQNPEPSISELFSSRIKMNHLRGEPQKYYRQGMPLFLFKPMNTLSEGTFDIFAIPNLNYYLEMAFLFKEERGLLSPRGQYGKSPRKKQLEFYDGYPTTVSEFGEMIYPYGIMTSSLEPTEIRKRWIASGLQGETTMVTNIWGEVEVGDIVGLKVVETENNLDSLINFNGQRLGEATQGKFLQVVPHIDRGLAKPVRCTNFKNPGPKDMDFYSKQYVRQKVYDTSGGFVDWEKPLRGKDSNLVADFYTQGIYYKLGRVLRVETSFPNQSDIDEAMRSFQGWNNLKDHYITIETHPHPQMWNF
jgi:hypothetical protein